VKVPPVPQGQIMIQVIATGWHTYGKWYEINRDEDSIDIKLQPRLSGTKHPTDFFLFKREMFRR